MPDDSQAVLRVAGLSWREVGDQIVVLDADRSVYLTVTGAGVSIWQTLVQGATLDDIVAALQDEFEVDGEVARKDAMQFLDDLRGRGLLAAG